jgi:CBS domain-containing protein
MQSPTRVEGSYLSQSLEHGCVSDAMRTGVLTCGPETPLETVARMMATHHIHSVVVTAAPEAGGLSQAWGIVSDLDLAKAAASSALDCTAGEMAVTEIVTIEPQESLERAAQLMAEHEIAHLIVVDATLGRPVGVISTLDLAGVVGWGRA